jgi:hypothetical protein
MKPWNVQSPFSAAADRLSSIGISPPSRRIALISTRLPRRGPSPLSRNLRNPSRNPARIRRGTTNSSSGRPIASSAGQPNVFSAAGFQLVMVPARSTAMNASLDEFRISRWRARDAASTRRDSRSHSVPMPTIRAIGKYTQARATYPNAPTSTPSVTAHATNRP